MKWLFPIFLLFNIHTDMRIDFGSESDDNSWRIVDDRVMGGMSQGRIGYDDEIVKFYGDLSLENNGGFSWAQFDLMNSTELTGNFKLRIKTDEHQYSFTAKTDRDRGYHFESKSFSTNGEWMELEVPLLEMTKTWRGRIYDDVLMVKDIITEIGIILKDKQEGKFYLELDWLEIEAA